MYLYVCGAECICRAWSDLISTTQLAFNLTWNFYNLFPGEGDQVLTDGNWLCFLDCKLMLIACALIKGEMG